MVKGRQEHNFSERAWLAYHHAHVSGPRSLTSIALKMLMELLTWKITSSVISLGNHLSFEGRGARGFYSSSLPLCYPGFSIYTAPGSINIRLCCSESSLGDGGGRNQEEGEGIMSFKNLSAILRGSAIKFN